MLAQVDHAASEWIAACQNLELTELDDDLGVVVSLNPAAEEAVAVR